MNASFLIIAALVVAAALVSTNTVLLSREAAREPAHTPGAGEARDTAPDRVESPPEVAEPRLPEANPSGDIALGALSPDLARLRAVDGVRGVALWGSEGALLLAEGELMEPLLPEAAALMRSVIRAASGLGSGRWASFAVEGVDGAIQGVRVGGLSLVVVASAAADRKEVERLLHEAAISSRDPRRFGDEERASAPI